MEGDVAHTLPLSSISLMKRWQGEGIKLDGYILLQEQSAD